MQLKVKDFRHTRKGVPHLKVSGRHRQVKRAELKKAIF
jgi:hypothetical protein